MSGRICCNAQVKDAIAEVSLEDLPTGIYLIEVVDLQGKTTISRFVKK